MMKHQSNIFRQEGISTPVSLAVVLGMIVIIGAAYFITQNQPAGSPRRAVYERETAPAAVADNPAAQPGETTGDTAESLSSTGGGQDSQREACPQDRPACPAGEDQVCSNGRWVCIGPADPARNILTEPVIFSGQVLAGSLVKLYDFNRSDYEAALSSDSLIVLYFYANWCPICKAETQNSLYPAFNESAASNVVGFRVNFNDNQTDGFEEDLAREFGVAYQHTKVFVKNGERILKSPEAWDKDRYLEEIRSNQ